MSVQFCVLGSGSEGNAALLMTPRLHVLIDAGFGPDELAARMNGTGASWESLDAVVLTHTHADHIKKKCLAACAEFGVEFICHERHAEQIGGARYFKRLNDKKLLRIFDVAAFEVRCGKAEDGDTLHFQPIPLPHDCPPTFGFRIEAQYKNGHAGTDENGRVKLGYLADLGNCSEQIAREVADVDLLALEFNHDETMERRSGRHPSLIQRVLGDEGHLSNAQAAQAFRRVLAAGSNGGPKLLVQIHLSRDCNTAELAYRAAQEVVLTAGAQTRVFTTRQERRGTVHAV